MGSCNARRCDGDNLNEMWIESKGRWVLPGIPMGYAHAAPIEGELGSNAAALLVLLGLWALFMGMRNLRELRHKRLVLNREKGCTGADPVENSSPEAHN